MGFHMAKRLAKHQNAWTSVQMTGAFSIQVNLLAMTYRSMTRIDFTDTIDEF